MSLTDFLDWLGRPGQAARNVLTGNMGGAARQLGQFALDPLDALIPGDQIQIARPEDTVGGQDLLEKMGMSEEDSLTKSVLGFGAEVVTDPLFWVPGKVLGTAAKAVTGAGVGAVKAAADAVTPASMLKPGMTAGEGVQSLVDDIGNFAADTFNWNRMSPEQAQRVRSVGAIAGQSSKAQSEELMKFLPGFSPAEKAAAVDIINNVKMDKATSVAELLDPKRTGGFGTLQEQIGRVLPSVAAHPDVAAGAVDAARVQDLVTKALQHGGTQWDEAMASGIMQGQRHYKVVPGLHPDIDAVSQAGYVLQSDLKKVLEDRMATAAAQAGTKPVPVTLNDVEAFAQQQAMGAADNLMPYAYLPRATKGFDLPLDPQVGVGGAPAPLKARTLDSDQSLVDWLNAKIDAPAGANAADVAAQRQGAFSRDLDKLMAERAAAQGRMLQKASAAQKIIPGSVLSNSQDMKKVAERLTKLEQSGNPAMRDYAVQMRTMIEGMGERGPITGSLAMINRIFKKGATMGVVVPNVAFGIRNRLGAGIMATSEANAKGGIVDVMRDPAALAALNPVAAAKDIMHAGAAYAAEVAGKNPLAWGDEVNKTLDTVEQAYKASGGRRDAFLNAIPDPVVREMVAGGVVDSSMIAADDLVKAISTGKPSLAERLWDAPARANGVLENRMRASVYLAQRAKGVPHTKAADFTTKALGDYRMGTSKNRIFRDLFPFGAFMSIAVPQALKSPATIAAYNATMGGGEGEPLYPWMEGNANMPLGLDEQGNPQYATSLGLPHEVLSHVNPLDASDVFSAANPLLKTTFASLTGEDPYFQTPFGSYDKMPRLAETLGLVGEDRSGGDLGAFINKARMSGVTMPFEAAIGLRQWETLLDPRLSAGETTAKLLTGIRPVSVDPDLAERQQIEDWLKAHPREVKSYQQYYTTEPNAEIDKMLADFRAAKDRLKEKRKAAELAAAGQ